MHKHTNSQRQDIKSTYKTMYGRDLEEDLKKDLGGKFIEILATLRPSGSFNPERVAAKLQKAIKGIGTDERAIIEVLTSHTNSQRQDIKSTYKTMYGRDLEEDLKKDLGGSFEDCCLALLVSQYEYLADCLNNSLQFSGDFQRVLRSLVNANRNETNGIDSDLSVKEAKILFQSGVKMMGTDEDEFLRILCSHSLVQLKDIFKHYSRLSGHSMDSAISKEFSGDLFTVFNAIVLSANSFAYYYAIRLHSCIHGIGTDDESMARILISRSEIDLEDIKDVYKKKFSHKLTEDIANDTSGDYKKNF
ncbi:unnamed protein product [Medioppia subpectinata]|uniref:Annexin n=1 Tax=Medioppia subpectinata TaxID=1979941 RepID=A0A7R9KVQ7_9ACAR|nr:unnamed protein product [Medioppia subpectinata]CAG2110744.1 unnamed protein product [Medioppia subpectinata]